jgi:hypothetical protein
MVDNSVIFKTQPSVEVIYEMHKMVRQHPNEVRGEKLNPGGSSKLFIWLICQSKPTSALASHKVLLSCEAPWQTKTPLRPFDSCNDPVSSIGTCWSLSDNASGSGRSVNVKGRSKQFQMSIPRHNRFDIYHTYSLTYNILGYTEWEREYNTIQ